MIPGGPGPFGGPEEPGGPGDDEPSAGGAPGGANSPSGWIPPSDRTWRHPSELGHEGEPDRPGGLGASDTRDAARKLAVRPDARNRVASVGVVTAAVLAVAVGSFLLLRTGEGPGTPGSSAHSAVQGPVTASATCCRFTATALRRAERGLVAIDQPGGGRLLGCGVVVAGAGLVATTADAVAGRGWVWVVTSSGKRLRASVMAVDRTSDVAVLSVRATLDVARFANDADLGPGFPTTTLHVPVRHPRPGSSQEWSSATVASVGTAVPRGDAAGMAAIMVRGTSLSGVAGQPLYDADGEVLGLLDPAGATGGRWPYLPSSLVVGVADQLATAGKVRHGWLDAQLVEVPSTTPAVPTTLASDATSAGARVVSVDPGGPATRALRPGDVIVAVDGQPVRSMAELRDRLYVLPPGTRTTLTTLRAGRSVTEVVELAASP